MNYFVVYFGEDGITITPQNKEQVEKMVNTLVAETQVARPGSLFVEKFPHDVVSNGWSMNDEYPEGKYLIIKGEMVIPQPIQTVVKYEI